MKGLSDTGWPGMVGPQLAAQKRRVDISCGRIKDGRH